MALDWSRIRGGDDDDTRAAVETEVRGVRIGDVYRDKHGSLWEVFSLVTEPQAGVRKVQTNEQEHHVIGCRNWTEKWAEGPMRAVDTPQ